MAAPNAEDLSLILGNVQGPRVRSYSTTISPKIPDTRVGNNVNVSTLATESPAVRRKKSMPTNSGPANNNNKAENKYGCVNFLRKNIARFFAGVHRTETRLKNFS